MDNTSDYAHIVDALREITKNAFALHMKQGVREASHKSANDLLTDADLKMDTYIKAQLLEQFPNCQLLTEESLPDTQLRGDTFVIDPIDGTCNFAAGIELCGIQIAMFRDKTCVLAVLYLPYRGAFYHACLGGGAYCNGQRIQADPEVLPADGILQLSDFYPAHPVPLQRQFDCVQSLQGQFLKTRLFGAAVVDFTNLAAGKAQAYLCYYHHIWDIAPGLLLAQEAGCLVSGLETEYTYGDPVLLAANNRQTLELLRRALQEE